MTETTSDSPFGRIGKLMSQIGARRAATDGTVSQTKASTWVAMVSMITGGFIALQTYSLEVSKQVDGSVEKTFDMVAMYNSGDLTKPRAHVLSYVYARRECDARIFSRELTDDDFVRVIEFFDLAHACVDARLCDGKTATDFFSPHANFQWPVLERIVGEMKDNKKAVRADGNFGVGMKAFATNPVEAEVCNGNF